MKKVLLKRGDLVFPELSFQIVGILFDVYNKLGYGLSEKTYQNAISVALKNSGLIFREQADCPVIYQNKNVGRNYLDFLIEDKIILEIKRGDRFAKIHIDQVLQYLSINKLKLGILAYFAPRKLHYKRLVNL